MRKFEFTKDGLTVSYRKQDGKPFTRSVRVDLHTGDNFDKNGSNAHRVDDLSDGVCKYIQNRLNEMDLKEDAQTIGNKVCELYWGIIV